MKINKKSLIKNMLLILVAIFCISLTQTTKASSASSYWKNYFSTEERKAVQKNAEKYTRKEIESKSKDWKGLISSYNIKNGSIKSSDIKDNGIELDKIKGLDTYLSQMISSSTTNQDFSADKLTGSYAGLDGSQITNLNPASITGGGNLNVGNGNLFVDDTTGNVGIGTMIPGNDLDVNGTVKTTNLYLTPINPPSAPSVAINNTSGNLSGTYMYRITFVTAEGETEEGSRSDSVVVSNQQIDITDIPISSSTSVIARNIYRSDGTTSGGWLYRLNLITTLNDNTTTTYTDNVSTPTTPINGINTTGGYFQYGSNGYPFIVDTQTTAFGIGALASNNSVYNTAIGIGALHANTIGYYNTALGGLALNSNTSGFYNLALGTYALQSNTTGNSNVAIGGERTMIANTTGIQNIAIGNDALGSNNTGGQNIAIGLNTLYNNDGSQNIAIGNGALALNVSGTQNIAMGISASSKSTGSYTIGLGRNALSNNIADGIVGIGTNALQANTNGIWQTCIGNSCLYSATGLGNTALGSSAGSSITTGTQNVFIGAQSGNASQVNNISNSIAIGYSTYTTASNQVILGNSNITQTLLRGNVGIGTTDPKTKLEVDGIIKTKERSTATCDTDTKGGIYFDSDDNHFYGCNGTAWIQLDN